MSVKDFFHADYPSADCCINPDYESGCKDFIRI